MHACPSRSGARLRPLAALAALAVVVLPGASLAQPTFDTRATPVEGLKVRDGFQVELLYTVPKAQEGSWVAMCPDPKGRLIVSDQYGKLYRITPPPVGGKDPAAVETLDVEIGQAQGLLHAFDSLYVMVANEAFQGRGLYRLRDTNGDDQFDEVRQLRKFEGGGEHGVHAIVLSPDGKSLHIVSGNQTKFPGFDTSRVPLLWSEDRLLPRLWDGNGFMKGVLAPGGWIARTDPEGREWELVATGFRNEYDAAFNRDGELFTYDADMEWDMNTPWYRPTRVNHVVSGAEFGWRSGAGKWPAHYPDSVGAVADVGPGSPTGVAFGYGARFPARYQDAFFICDWSYGKLYAVHLQPDGASYRGTVEEFISGSPLPLTDLVVNPRDGAMYFAIGGRRTQSALYRVTYTGSESTAPSPGNPEGAEARALRSRLEAFHGRAVPGAVDAIWPHLGDPDRAIRYAARVALEWQPADGWRDRALAEVDPAASRQALMALARVTARDEFHRSKDAPAPDPALLRSVLAALDRQDWGRMDTGARLELLRAHTLAFTRLGRPEDAVRRRLAARFEPLFPTAHRELNAELAQLLVFLEAPTAAARLVAHLEKAPTQEEQLDFARFLRVLRTGWTPALRETYFRWFLETGSFRGGASLAGFLRDIRNDAIAGLTDSERAALGTLLEAKPESRKPLDSLLAGREVVREWTVDELAPVLAGGLKGRNYDRGRDLFGAVGCYTCHRFATEGGAVGPDLTGVAGRFNPRDLLESIIDPSKEVSDQYAPIIVTKKDGDTVIGRIANLNNDGLSIATDMTDPGNFTNVKRGDIVSIETATVSPMPEGMLNTLKRDEILDLLAFLLSRGNREDPMFR